MESSSTTLPDIKEERLLMASVAKVWPKVSTAEGMGSWFMPSNMEAVEGREFTLEAGPFGQSPCQVIEVKPQQKLAFRWGKDWTLTFELAEQAEGTHFTLIHSGWDADKLTEFGQAHAVIRERMAQGWAGLVEKLAEVMK